MKEDLYSTDQVAELLGLHVRTVRGWIRAGRLRAVRIGKEYRITQTDLDVILRNPPAGEISPAATSPAGGFPSEQNAEVSSFVSIDGVNRAQSDRLSTLVRAVTQTEGADLPPLRVQTVYDPQRYRLKIVILGGVAACAEILRTLDALLTDSADASGGVTG